MEIIKVENLSFAHQGNKSNTLSDISFSVRKGDFVILYGASGCGKSTLLSLMKKELAPVGRQRGTIYYKGTDVAELNDRVSALEIGYVMQDPDSQIVTDKVYRELAFGLENIGAPKNYIKSRVAEISSVLGINKLYYNDTDSLSGGQKQLLNLAAVMTMNPELLLLDEPVSQLDPFSAASFLDMLMRFNREYGLTVIIAEHNLERIFSYADNIAVIEETRLKYYGVPRTCCDHFTKEAPVIEGLPLPARLYQRFEIEEVCPTDVREARAFLRRYCLNVVRYLEKPKKALNKAYAIELDNIYFRYKKNSPDIIKNLSLKIRKGEIYALVGGNGSGKTTLLSILTGSLKPYSGKIYINKIKAGNANPYRIAAVPQNPLTLFTKDTLRNDLFDFALSCGIPNDIVQSAVYDLCRLLGVIDILRYHPYDLSGGEVQKAALAKIMIGSPDIILLDEPTKGVDAWSKRSFAEILKRLSRKGKAVIIVTHDNDFAAEAADKCGMLFDGAIVSEAPADIFYGSNDFYTTTASRITKGIFDNAVTFDDIIRLCKENGAVK